MNRLNNPVWVSTGPAPPSFPLASRCLPRVSKKSSTPYVVVCEYGSKKKKDYDASARRLLPLATAGLARRDMHRSGNTRADPVHCVHQSRVPTSRSEGTDPGGLPFSPGLNKPPWVSLSCFLFPCSFIFVPPFFLPPTRKAVSRRPLRHLRGVTLGLSPSFSPLARRVCFSLSVSLMCPYAQLR